MLLGLFFYTVHFDRQIDKTFTFIIAARSTKEAGAHVTTWFKDNSFSWIKHKPDLKEIRHIGYAKDGTKPGILHTV